MNKIALVFFLGLFLVACGPHRMQCGPGKRCVEKTQKEKILIKQKVKNA
jgi:hypothetical protein